MIIFGLVMGTGIQKATMLLPKQFMIGLSWNLGRPAFLGASKRTGTVGRKWIEFYVLDLMGAKTSFFRYSATKILLKLC